MRLIITSLAALLMLAGGAGFSWATGPVPQDRVLMLDVAGKPVTAQDFKALTVDGKTYRLNDLKGKVVFMNFWATWCVPCLLEMPSMERLNKKMAGKPFKMIAVNQGEELPRIRKFLKDKDFTYDLLLDVDGTIGENYGVNRLPLTYLLDQEGKIVRRAIGAREWDRDEVVELLDHLIQADPARESQTTALPAR